MKNRVICILLVLVFALALIGPAGAAKTGVSVTIDKKPVSFSASDGAPFIDENSRTLVPLRVVMETYGCIVQWDQNTKTAYVVKDGVTVTVTIGQKYIRVNGMSQAIDTAAVIKDSRTYLPIRAVLEAFGAEVEWDAASRTVVVTHPATEKSEPINGKDGVDGKDGINGKDGADGKDGVSGKDGADGKDGINGKDGVDGKDGQNGKDGIDGKDGISVTDLKINDNGNLIVTLSDGQMIDAGMSKGKDGADGADGVSVANAAIDEDGNLILTLSNQQTINAGAVTGANEPPEEDIKTAIDLGPLEENAFISKTDGTKRTDTKVYSCTDFLEVKGRYFEIENCMLLRSAGICEYDENKSFIRCVLSDISGSAKFAVSENAKYLRISVYSAQQNETKLFNISDSEYIANLRADDILIRWEDATNGRIDQPLNRISSLPPTITLIDDDTTSVELVERYHAICEEMGVKGNYAVITSRLENNDELKNLLLRYEEQGYGMLYHCYSQTEAACFQQNTRDLALCEENYCKGVRQMRQFGFTNYDYWVSPFGVNDKEMQDMCRRHGAKCLISTYNNTFIRANGMTGSGVAERYNIPRCSLGHNDERYPNFPISNLKAQIDACASSNGWLVITTHVNEWGSTTQGDDRLREIIQYAKDHGFAFKSFAEAFEERLPMFYLSEIL